MEPIPCLDIKQQQQLVKKEVFELFEQVFDSAAFSGGSFVEKFENSFSAFCGSKHAVGINNGTSAIHLAMLALGIGKGDEVIIPANTFIATAWGVSYVGATPVFVDCKEDTWEIDASKIEEKITSKTKAVIGVHLYGQPFDIDAVRLITEKYKLYLVEDAAQAHGALYKGEKIGTFGDLACFSFYPGKNLGACGEAGGITTNNTNYYSHILKLRNHGSVIRYYHDELGFNMRMGGLEAASLLVKIKYIEGWNTRRKEIARIYQSRISNPKIKFQNQPSTTDSVYHLFVVTTENKDDFMKFLNSHLINPGLHYPVPCHLQNAYKHLNYKQGDFPNSEYLASHCVSLPMFAELTNDQVEYIVDVVNKY